MGPFTVTPQRETVSDLTYPLSGADKAILMARPKLDTDMAGFVKAFTYEVRRREEGREWCCFPSHHQGMMSYDELLSYRRGSSPSSLPSSLSSSLSCWCALRTPCLAPQ